MKDRILLVTSTGEKFQPIRVYYDVLNLKSIINVFRKLKCIDYDNERFRYVWVYRKEARKIKFGKDSDLQDVVLGSFFISRNRKEVYLEVNSIERAIAGINFFEERMKSYMAKITDITIINKLFEYDKSLMQFSHLFENEVKMYPEKEIEKVKNAFGQGESFLDILNNGKTQLPEVERFPSHYYEDGLNKIKLSLFGRQHVAYQHWIGNKDYTLTDYIFHITQK